MLIVDIIYSDSGLMNPEATETRSDGLLPGQGENPACSHNKLMFSSI
jgi:hypothetical protein